jgi:hypothetical protein
MTACAPRSGDSDDISGYYSATEAHALARVIATLAGGRVYEVSSLSNSMAEISHNEFVIIVPTYDRLKAGQIVLFRSGNHLVLHKVTYGNQDGWKTGGTNNRRSDAGWLTETNYVGTYAGRILYDPTL